MEEGRRASHGLLPSISTFSMEPGEERSKSARASFSRSPATSTLALDKELAPHTTSLAQINDALRSIDWTPVLGGSSYSINRSYLCKSPMSRSPASRSPVSRSPVSRSPKSSRATPVPDPETPPEPEVVINVEDTDTADQISTIDIWESYTGNIHLFHTSARSQYL